MLKFIKNIFSIWHEARTAATHYEVLNRLSDKQLRERRIQSRGDIIKTVFK